MRTFNVVLYLNSRAFVTETTNNALVGSSFLRFHIPSLWDHHKLPVGEKNWRAPNRPKDPAPLGLPVQQGQGVGLVPTPVYCKTGLNKQMSVFNNKGRWLNSNIGDKHSPRSQSIAGWFRCWCLGLQSTTECSGAFGLNTDELLSLSLAK